MNLVLSIATSGCALLWLLSINSVFAGDAKEVVDAATRPAFASFVAQNCTDCHGEFGQEAGLRLDTLNGDLTDTDTFAVWAKVHDRVRAGEMPPPDSADLPLAERQAFLESVSASLTVADRERQRNSGRTVLRRLNRIEYENTLRDLLALPDLEVKEMLPEDGESHGFDNVAAALHVSSVQMARYLDAADAVLEAAITLDPRPETKTWRDTPVEGNGLVAKRLTRKPREAVQIDEAVGFMRQGNSAQTPWTWNRFQPHAEGAYRLRFKQFGFVWDDGTVLPADRPHVIVVYAKQGHEKRRLAAFDVPGTVEEAVVSECIVWLRPGEVIDFQLATLDDRNFKEGMKIKGPGIAFEWWEATGPLLDQWPPESHRRLLGDLPVIEWTRESSVVQPPPPMHVVGSDKREKRVPDLKSPRRMVVSGKPTEDAARLLRDFMNRAFRRPVVEEEVGPYLALVQAKLSEKHAFQEALKLGYKAILCSPDFLYFREEPGRLDDYALASRLSYFLWKSMADEKLFSLARSGELSRSETLRGQVERMLDDPKAERFVEDFTGQWLDLRRIIVTEPDEQLYPEFDQLLLDSMIEETQAYFRRMLHSDLGAAHLVDSDFVMLNGRLAELYGIADVEGVEVREVPLPADSVRGGLLTQASLLKVTANGTTTSPVTRGAWVLDRILGDPAAPPPPNVPAIEPDTRGATTVRQLLELHRADAACAGCHSKIDPPGFALESFDVIGGFRERYRSLGDGEKVDTIVRDKPVRYTLGPPVDPTGRMADGDSFENIEGFRNLLLSDQRQLARNLAERLLVYATGAGVSFADREVVDGILDRTRDDDYGLRTMIHAIVQSDAFRSK